MFDDFAVVRSFRPNRLPLHTSNGVTTLSSQNRYTPLHIPIIGLILQLAARHKSFPMFNLLRNETTGLVVTHFSGRTHFHGTGAPPPKSESSASKSFGHSGMTAAFKTTFDVFTSVGPDNSLERLTERCVGLVTDQPGDVDELLLPLLE